MTNIAIENDHLVRGFSHWKWWFSIVMLVYQRVSLKVTQTFWFKNLKPTTSPLPQCGYVSRMGDPAMAGSVASSMAPWLKGDRAFRCSHNSCYQTPISSWWSISQIPYPMKRHVNIYICQSVPYFFYIPTKPSEIPHHHIQQDCQFSHGSWFSSTILPPWFHAEKSTSKSLFLSDYINPPPNFHGKKNLACCWKELSAFTWTVAPGFFQPQLSAWWVPVDIGTWWIYMVNFTGE